MKFKNIYKPWIYGIPKVLHGAIRAAQRFEAMLSELNELYPEKIPHRENIKKLAASLKFGGIDVAYGLYGQWINGKSIKAIEFHYTYHYDHDSRELKTLREIDSKYGKYIYRRGLK